MPHTTFAYPVCELERKSLLPIDGNECQADILEVPPKRRSWPVSTRPLNDRGRP